MFFYSIILRALQIFAKVIHDKFTQEFEKEVCINYCLMWLLVKLQVTIPFYASWKFIVPVNKIFMNYKAFDIYWKKIANCKINCLLFTVMGIFLQVFNFIPYSKVFTTWALYKLQEDQNSLQVRCQPLQEILLHTVNFDKII